MFPRSAVALFGKYLCFALLALSLDLIWGYCGILSLGHGAFFALGGYAMGMYLMRQIGARGVYANPDLARLHGLPQLAGAALVLVRLRAALPFALLMVLLVPGVLAFVFGWFAFRSRVTGVYLSIITQALDLCPCCSPSSATTWASAVITASTDFKDIARILRAGAWNACHAVCAFAPSRSWWLPDRRGGRDVEAREGP